MQISIIIQSQVVLNHPKYLLRAQLLNLLYDSIGDLLGVGTSAQVASKNTLLANVLDTLQ